MKESCEKWKKNNNKGNLQKFKIAFYRITKKNSIIKNEQFPNAFHFRKGYSLHISFFAGYRHKWIGSALGVWVIELEEIYLIRQITEICVTEPHSSRTRGVIPARYSYITSIVSKTPRNHKLLNYYDTFLITKWYKHHSVFLHYLKLPNYISFIMQ